MNKNEKRLREKLNFYYKGKASIRLKYGERIVFGKILKTPFPLFGQSFILKLKDGNELKIFLDEVNNENLVPISNSIIQEKQEDRLELKRNSIPKSVKKQLWKNHFGDNFKGNCFVCRMEIYRDNWEAGHFISVANGGKDEISNLRPLCFDCNRSMGAQNLDSFVKEFIN